MTGRCLGALGCKRSIQRLIEGNWPTGSFLHGRDNRAHHFHGADNSIQALRGPGKLETPRLFWIAQYGSAWHTLLHSELLEARSG
jgi:hypothetical protein